MKRGEIWTVAGGPHYAGKPRPVLIVQSDHFDATESITICPFTTNRAEAPFIRLEVEPEDSNGLRETSRLMVDKITTVPRSRLDRLIGHVRQGTIGDLNRAIFVFLGLAEPPRPRRRRSEDGRRQLTRARRGAR